MNEEIKFWKIIDIKKDKLSVDSLLELIKKQEKYKYKFYKDCLEVIETENNNSQCEFRFNFNFNYLDEMQQIMLVYNFDKETVEFHKSLSLDWYFNDNNQRCRNYQTMGEYYMYNYIGNEKYPRFDLYQSWGETYCENLEFNKKDKLSFK
ncbi:hypothetical protein CBLAS_0097 [Campylobacter blaseri]|nr:hypothetical protein [Campylobacter blaseri]QKF85313.1 hypothetical protein CBLAS_0097 [Campylobacter blaseri]